MTIKNSLAVHATTNGQSRAWAVLAGVEQIHLGAVDRIGTPTAPTCSSDQEHVDEEKSSLILVHIFK